MAKTKTRMIDAARQLLVSKGAEATSVDDVLKATNTGKSQFYHYFGSKAGMVHAALGALISQTVHKPVNDWAGVQSWLSDIGHSGTNGHPLALIALSIRPEERGEFEELNAYYEDIRAPLLRFLETEQEAGRLLAGVKCVELADLALTCLIGATICTLTQRDSDVAARNAHHVTLYLKAYARA